MFKALFITSIIVVVLLGVMGIDQPPVSSADYKLILAGFFGCLFGMFLSIVGMVDGFIMDDDM